MKFKLLILAVSLSLCLQIAHAGQVVLDNLHRQVQERTERLARLEQVLTAQQSLAGLKTAQ